MFTAESWPSAKITAMSPGLALQQPHPCSCLVVMASRCATDVSILSAQVLAPELAGADSPPLQSTLHKLVFLVVPARARAHASTN